MRRSFLPPVWTQRVRRILAQELWAFNTAPGIFFHARLSAIFSQEDASYAERSHLSRDFQLRFFQFTSSPRDSSGQKMSITALSLFGIRMREVVQSNGGQVGLKRQRTTIESVEEAR